MEPLRAALVAAMLGRVIISRLIDPGATVRVVRSGPRGLRFESDAQSIHPDARDGDRLVMLVAGAAAEFVAATGRAPGSWAEACDAAQFAKGDIAAIEADGFTTDEASSAVRLVGPHLLASLTPATVGQTVAAWSAAPDGADLAGVPLWRH